jgi:hypothetical protein
MTVSRLAFDGVRIRDLAAVFPFVDGDAYRRHTKAAAWVGGEGRESREAREAREARESRESREAPESREVRESRESREAPESREVREAPESDALPDSRFVLRRYASGHSIAKNSAIPRIRTDRTHRSGS